MDRIQRIAKQYDLIVIEDAAHAVEATYHGRPLGSIGHLAAFSFHETKNVQCGEGGALLVNDSQFSTRAEIIQEKGTDRSRFFRGEIDKYTWQDMGSSYLLSEVASAFLWGQLEHAEQISTERRAIWSSYYDALEPLEQEGLLRRPVVPHGCEHSGHLFYVLLPTAALRDSALRALGEHGVHAVFHYLPLHDSAGGRRFGRLGGPVPVSDDSSSRLLRLPLWGGLGESRTEAVIDAVHAAVRSTASTFAH
jgi:dTDP-4-amino-4,6-dideoxygalactose transaminase